STPCPCSLSATVRSDYGWARPTSTSGYRRSFPCSTRRTYWASRILRVTTSLSREPRRPTAVSRPRRTASSRRSSNPERLRTRTQPSEVTTMPGVDELPDTLRRSPKKAQRTWIEAHDSAVDEYGEGGRAQRGGYTDPQ